MRATDVLLAPAHYEDGTGSLMRWSSRRGEPQVGLPLVHHNGGLNCSGLRADLEMPITLTAQLRRGVPDGEGNARGMGDCMIRSAWCSAMM